MQTAGTGCEKFLISSNIYGVLISISFAMPFCPWKCSIIQAIPVSGSQDVRWVQKCHSYNDSSLRCLGSLYGWFLCISEKSLRIRYREIVTFLKKPMKNFLNDWKFSWILVWLKGVVSCRYTGCRCGEHGSYAGHSAIFARAAWKENLFGWRDPILRL